MNLILYPEKSEWANLCKRPGLGKVYLEDAVRGILYKVKTEKDKALRFYCEKFDSACPEVFKVSEAEISASRQVISNELKSAVEKARHNIEKFHSSQSVSEPVTETSAGIRCWRKSVPIEKVGLYIPGGSAPLFSTLLMLGIPARLAGCTDITVCTPAGKDGKINPLILYTASALGLKNIYKIGGAQAIAAMAYGTESIPGVYKIFGPGNQYVTMAKQIVQQEGIAIDMPAGPSEVLVIADKKADPEFIAADLLSQAEHGPDSQVILVSDNKTILEQVKREAEKQSKALPRENIVLNSLENSKLILLHSLEDCVSFSNLYAPEHLIINTDVPNELAGKVTNAGSVFLGKFSCESMGDYASGTNHTLPTNGYARNYSGVSTDSFLKKITFQEVSLEGLKDLGPVVEIMAEAESLIGHRNAVSVRIKKTGL